MTFSLRMNEEDSAFVKNYAKMSGVDVSELLRKAALEWIEDEYDRKVYEKAMEEYRKNPVTYTHEEVCRMLELEE